jgi:hypothetical protein
MQAPRAPTSAHDERYVALIEGNDMSASLRIEATPRPLDPFISALAPWAPLLLRAVVGFGLVMHGYAKLARGPDTFAVVLHTLGVPLPVSWRGSRPSSS